MFAVTFPGQAESTQPSPRVGVSLRPPRYHRSPRTLRFGELVNCEVALREAGSRSVPRLPLLLHGGLLHDPITISPAMSSAALRSASFFWRTSTRAACQADQWPDTRAHSESEATYVMLFIHPVAIEIGIMAIQKIVSHPLTRCMKSG